MSTTTPNMNLILPIPTVTPGPTYAQETDVALQTIDTHDHTTGKGVPVPTAGINIDADLPLNNHDATDARSLRFTNHGAPLGAITDAGCVYESGGNLYYNNAAGTQIQITAGAALNATSIGAIGGDYATSTASLFYTAASETFFFTSAANKPANIDAAIVAVREPAISSNKIELKSPVALGSSYQLTLPSALPGTTKVLSLSATGALATGVVGSVVTADIADNNVTLPKLNFVPKLGSVSFLTTGATSWTVPANVTNIVVQLVGGGGGGGAGSANQFDESGGGAGGAGGTIVVAAAQVTPGETVTVTVGAGGSGGTVGSLPGTQQGTAGIQGGTTSVSSTTIGTIRAYGGTGGNPGTTAGVGGTSSTVFTTLTGVSAGGGAGTNSGAASGGAAGSSGIRAAGGAGGAWPGANPQNGGSGGGGGSGFGNGGAGGGGGAVGLYGGQPGTAAAANTGGGGGGGGGGGFNNNGGAGGAGGSGRVDIFYVFNT